MLPPRCESRLSNLQAVEVNDGNIAGLILRVNAQGDRPWREGFAAVGADSHHVVREGAVFGFRVAVGGVVIEWEVVLQVPVARPVADEDGADLRDLRVGQRRYRDRGRAVV